MHKGAVKIIPSRGGFPSRKVKIMAAGIALQKNIQLDNITKMQKSWTEERDGYVAECRVDVYFGTLRDGRFSPVVIMNVYDQGVGVKQVIDDNCDVWSNMFSGTTKNEGNDYYRYLLKHGFKKVEV